MRLVVDQTGTRVTAPECNVLTVVANDDEHYVSKYQQELAEDFGGTEQTEIRPGNARRRLEVNVNGEVARSRAFQTLWDRICRLTRFSVRVDTEALLAAVVPAVDRLDIQPIRVRVAKARVVAEGDEFAFQVLAGPRTVDRVSTEGTVQQLIETTLHLLSQEPNPCRITRRTLLEVFRRTTTKKAALANPHEWASATARIVREQLAEQLVNGIRYEVRSQNYRMEDFEEVIESWQDRVVKSSVGLYDHIICDSKPEREFVGCLERDLRTLAYVKLPRWYKVGTPIGAYNPDWAIARMERDEHGHEIAEVYFVAETKGLLLPDALRPNERRKISCGKIHFAALDVNFYVVRTLSDIDLQGELSDPH